MQSPDNSNESLDQARTLLRELIDRLQTDAPGGQAPTSLLRLLVHIANIQRAVQQSDDDRANAIKRLRDFANTIERLDAKDLTATGSDEVRRQLITVLRLAADQLSKPATPADSTANGESAALAS